MSGIRLTERERLIEYLLRIPDDQVSLIADFISPEAEAPTTSGRPIRVRRIGDTYMVKGQEMSPHKFETWRQSLDKNQLVLVSFSAASADGNHKSKPKSGAKRAVAKRKAPVSKR